MATVDASRMRARIEAALRESPSASHAALDAMAAGVADQIERTAKKDTNAYVASLMEGFHEAGVKGAPPAPKVQPSKYRGIQRNQLNRQVRELWEELLDTRRGIRLISAAYEASGYKRGRPLDVQGHAWRSRLLTLRAMERAYERLHKAAIEQLARFEANPHAIVFGVGRGAIARRNDARVGGESNQVSDVLPLIQEVVTAAGSVRVKGARLIVSVRKGGTRPDGTYGGTGRRVEHEQGEMIRVGSLEPHARILEDKYHTISAALAGARQYGLETIGKRWRDRVAAAAGSIA